MHLVVVSSTDKSGAPVKTALLQESYEEEGKIKTETLAKLTHCSDEEISAVQVAFQRNASTTIAMPLHQEHSLGAIWTVKKVIEKIGISDSLNEASEGKQLFFQLIRATVFPHLSPFRSSVYNIELLSSLLDLTSPPKDGATEKNLLWLEKQQSTIEYLIAKSSGADKAPYLFSYDVTSHYFHREEDPLSLVSEESSSPYSILSLCDAAGNPISLLVAEKGESELLGWQKVKEKWNTEKIIEMETKSSYFHHLSDDTSLHVTNAVTSSSTKEKICKELQEEKVNPYWIYEGSGFCYLFARKDSDPHSFQLLHCDIPKKEINPKVLFQRYSQGSEMRKAFHGHFSDIDDIKLVRGHAFFLQLQQIIKRTLSTAWTPLGFTVEEGISLLSTLCTVNSKDKTVLPYPSETVKKLLDALELTLPKGLHEPE